MKLFFLSCFLLLLVRESSAQFQNNIKFDEIIGPCGFAGCYANYYIGRIGDKKNWKYCLLDSNKIEITKCVYDEFDFCADYCGVWFINGYLRAKRNNKWGFVNEKGLEVINCEYDSTEYFQNGLALVCKNGKWGIINERGEFEIENKYDLVKGPYRDVYIVSGSNSNKGKKGLIKSNGTEITPCIYDDFIIDHYSDEGLFFDGVAMVKRDAKYGWLNKKGEEIIPCKYEEAEPFTDGLAKVKENGKWGIINERGEFVIENKFDSIIQLNDTTNRNLNWFAIVIENGQSIFIDNKGRKIKDCPFSRVEGFSSGLAAVQSGNEYGEWGFIDTNLDLVIPCVYGYIPDNCIMTWRYPPKFSSGHCLVISKKGCSVIDTQGQNIIPWSSCSFDIPPSEHLAIICINGKFGFLNNLFTIQVPCIYQYELLRCI